MDTITAKEALQNSESANLITIFKNIEKASKRGEKFIPLYTTLRPLTIYTTTTNYGYKGESIHYFEDSIILSNEEISLLHSLGYRIVKKEAITNEKLNNALVLANKYRHKKKFISRKPKHPESERAYRRLIVGFPNITEIHWN